MLSDSESSKSISDNNALMPKPGPSAQPSSISQRITIAIRRYHPSMEKLENLMIHCGVVEGIAD